MTPTPERESWRRRRDPNNCSSCGKPFKSDDYKTCNACRERIRKKDKTKYIWAIRRRTDGFCSSCGNEFTSERYKTCDACREKLRTVKRKEMDKNPEKVCERIRRWQVAHPERKRETQRRYVANHREQVNAKKRAEYHNNRVAADKRRKERRESHLEEERARDHEYYKLHREEILKQKAEYQRANPNIVNRNGQNHRARKLGNGGELPRGVVDTLFEQQSGVCYLCGELLYSRLNDPPQIEHMIPVSRGGINDITNVKLAHKSCNVRKGSRTVEEYLEKIKGV